MIGGTGPARRASSTHRSCGTIGSGSASRANQRRPAGLRPARAPPARPAQPGALKKKSTRSSTGLPVAWVRCMVVSGASAAGSEVTPSSSAASRQRGRRDRLPCSTWPAAAVAQCPSRVAGVAAQVQQHAPRRPAGAEQHVGGGDQAESHRRTLTAPRGLTQRSRSVMGTRNALHPTPVRRRPVGNSSRWCRMERAGLDVVWVAEAYSFDAVSVMGYLAARTERWRSGRGSCRSTAAPRR